MAEYVNKKSPQYSQQRKAKGMPMLRNFGIGPGDQPYPSPSPTMSTGVPMSEKATQAIKGIATGLAATFTGGLDAVYGTGKIDPATGKVTNKKDDSDDKKDDKENDEKNGNGENDKTKGSVSVEEGEIVENE